MQNYPLVTETGETFLTDGQLLRFIREKCGAAVADFLTCRIDTDEMPFGGDDALKKLKNALEGISIDISEIDENIDNLMSLIDNVRGGK
jgi:hypothetical protein